MTTGQVNSLENKILNSEKEKVKLIFHKNQTQNLNQKKLQKNRSRKKMKLASI